MKIVIVDDIEKVRFSLKTLIAENYPQATIVGEAHDVNSAIETINNSKPDVVLLDIQMPDGSGFDLLKKLMPVNFKIIFITAHQEFALEAFRFSALDYLLKPIKANDLVSALNKASEQMKVNDLNLKLNTFLNNMSEITRDSKKIVIKAKDSLRIVTTGEIIRCEADSNYTRIFLKDGKNIFASETLKDYEETLNNYGFFRSHHSHLVNIGHINSFEKRGGGTLIMSDKSEVPVSVRKKDSLLSILEKV